jgi:hypothetical protein
MSVYVCPVIGLTYNPRAFCILGLNVLRRQFAVVCHTLLLMGTAYVSSLLSVRDLYVCFNSAKAAWM